MRRGIATITIYVSGENDQEMYDDAKMISEKMNHLFDCRATVDKLHSSPFGKLDVKEIDFKDLEV